MNLFDYLTHNSRSFPEKLAIAHGTAPFASWRELRQRAEKLATGIGLPPSSRVAIVSKNCPEYIEILFACWAAGLVVVPINAKLHRREVGELLECSKASMVFVSEEIETCPDWNATVIGSDAYETLLCNEPRERVLIPPQDRRFYRPLPLPTNC
jgi:acyl-CoA synthetase (AMP-forming)/AMP-acid ligase II